MPWTFTVRFQACQKFHYVTSSISSSISVFKSWSSSLPLLNLHGYWVIACLSSLCPGVFFNFFCNLKDCWIEMLCQSTLVSVCLWIFHNHILIVCTVVQIFTMSIQGRGNRGVQGAMAPPPCTYIGVKGQSAHTYIRLRTFWVLDIDKHFKGSSSESQLAQLCLSMQNLTEDSFCC